LRKNFLNNNIF